MPGLGLDGDRGGIVQHDGLTCEAGACAGDEPAGDPLGTAGCEADDECSTGVCWDFANYDALCGGSACSTVCVDDQDCAAAFAAAGAENPLGATCGADGRCSPIGSGFGAFFCQ